MWFFFLIGCINIFYFQQILLSFFRWGKSNYSVVIFISIIFFCRSIFFSVFISDGIAFFIWYIIFEIICLLLLNHYRTSSSWNSRCAEGCVAKIISLLFKILLDDFNNIFIISMPFKNWNFLKFDLKSIFIMLLLKFILGQIFLMDLIIVVLMTIWIILKRRLVNDIIELWKDRWFIVLYTAIHVHPSKSRLLLDPDIKYTLIFLIVFHLIQSPQTTLVRAQMLWRIWRTQDVFLIRTRKERYVSIHYNFQMRWLIKVANLVKLVMRRGLVPRSIDSRCSFMIDIILLLLGLPSEWPNFKVLAQSILTIWSLLLRLPSSNWRCLSYRQLLWIWLALIWMNIWILLFLHIIIRNDKNFKFSLEIYIWNICYLNDQSYLPHY